MRRKSEYLDYNHISIKLIQDSLKHVCTQVEVNKVNSETLAIPNRMSRGIYTPKFLVNLYGNREDNMS